LKKEKIYVLKNKELRIEIIWLCYNVLIVGYEERWKITELVTRNYWQPRVTKNIEKYMNGCNIYQRMKNGIKVPVENLIVNKVSKKSWTYLTVNFITKLPLVARKDIILVVYVVQNGIFYSNNRENVSRRIDEAV